MVRSSWGMIAAVSVALLCAFQSYAQEESRNATHEKTCLRIGSTFSNKHSVDSRVEQNMRAVLGILGICMDVVAGPPRRLTEELIRGDLDGELFRVSEYAQAVGETALLVDEPIADVVGYLVAAQGTDLSQVPLAKLKVGILRGVKWHLTASGGAGEVITGNDMDQLLFMLRNRRVDGILVGGFLRDEYPELSNLPAKVAYKSTAHFVLHRSQAHLAMPIAGAIRAFKQRGCSFVLAEGGGACSDSGRLDDELRQENGTDLAS